MPDPNDQPIIQSEPTTIKFWLTWLAQQGIAIIVLVGVTCALGYYLYKVIPERDTQRDAAWSKVVAEQAQEFRLAIEERDKRSLEYRTKADERFAKALTDLLAAKDKDIDRVVSLLTSRINDVQKHAERTAAKVEAITP